MHLLEIQKWTDITDLIDGASQKINNCIVQ